MIDYVITLQPNGKKGIRMKKEIYDSLKGAMLNLLENHPEISSQSFFGVLNDQFVGVLGDNTGWYLYQVKLDIQAKGIITTIHTRKRGRTKALIKRLVDQRSAWKFSTTKNFE